MKQEEDLELLWTAGFAVERAPRKAFVAMADWQEAVQASLFAIFFALMIAKLVSVVISFRGDNLRVEREGREKELLFEAEEVAVRDTGCSSESEGWDEDQEIEEKALDKSEKVVCVNDTELPLEAEVTAEVKDVRDAGVGLHPLVVDQTKKQLSSYVEEEDAKAVKGVSAVVKLDEKILEGKNEEEIKNSFEAVGELSDSDDWEGVESSELDERFGAAASFVASQAIGPGLKVSNETQLLLYGLYKLATEGPCSTPQPLPYKMSARAKWNAWQKLGNIGLEEAMHRYIAVVAEISPSWAQGIENTVKQAGDSAEGDASQHGGMGPVFSSLVMTEEGVGEEGTLETIHMCAREGDQAGLQQQIEIGTPVDLKDSDGRTALHWAADRGHLHAIELLLAKGAQIHAKDLEGQTALHYAATCEQEEIAKHLVKKGAEPSMTDNEGVSPLNSCPVHWLWMGGGTA